MAQHSILRLLTKSIFERTSKGTRICIYWLIISGTTEQSILTTPIRGANSFWNSWISDFVCIMSKDPTCCTCYFHSCGWPLPFRPESQFTILFNTIVIYIGAMLLYQPPMVRWPRTPRNVELTIFSLFRINFTYRVLMSRMNKLNYLHIASLPRLLFLRPITLSAEKKSGVPCILTSRERHRQTPIEEHDMKTRHVDCPRSATLVFRSST